MSSTACRTLSSLVRDTRHRNGSRAYLAFVHSCSLRVPASSKLLHLESAPADVAVQPGFAIARKGTWQRRLAAADYLTVRSHLRLDAYRQFDRFTLKSRPLASHEDSP